MSAHPLAGSLARCGLLAAALIACRSSAVSPATRSVPFQNGPPLQRPGGIFRVPVVASLPDGTVLAFAEDRYSHGDGNALQIVLRRSTSRGKTWGGVQVVVNDTDARDAAMGDGVTNGMVVTDARTNRTFFFYNQCSHLCQYTKAFFISSEDSGKSWTPPVNITDVLLPSKAHPAGVDVVQWGEGQGVQLNNGRLIVCGWYGFYKSDFDRGVACILSDTGGESWRIGGVLAHPETPKFLQPDEVGIALLPNGSILLNARAETGCEVNPCPKGHSPRGIGGHRILARSDDGGESIVDEHIQYDLPDTDCNGGLVSLDGGRLLVFSNPSPLPFKMGLRQNLTLHISTNGNFLANLLLE
eukprot:COSAG06_NODE_1083_length_10780_cov_2.547608_6_plen_356_part_00